jgi:hypothetical protein
MGFWYRSLRFTVLAPLHLGHIYSLARYQSMNFYGVGTMSITPEQCRAARALLGWSALELAEHANVGYSTVADFERGARSPLPESLTAMRTALERGGVLFIPGNGEGPGVRLKGLPTVAGSGAVAGAKASRPARNTPKRIRRRR